MPEIEELDLLIEALELTPVKHRFAVGDIVTINNYGAGFGRGDLGREVRITELGVYGAPRWRGSAPLHTYRCGYRCVFVDTGEVKHNAGYANFVGEASFLDRDKTVGMYDELREVEQAIDRVRG